jgi:hypothetical protein
MLGTDISPLIPAIDSIPIPAIDDTKLTGIPHAAPTPSRTSRPDAYKHDTVHCEAAEKLTVEGDVQDPLPRNVSVDTSIMPCNSASAVAAATAIVMVPHAAAQAASVVSAAGEIGCEAGAGGCTRQSADRVLALLQALRQERDELTQAISKRREELVQLSCEQEHRSRESESYIEALTRELDRSRSDLHAVQTEMERERASSDCKRASLQQEEQELQRTQRLLQTELSECRRQIEDAQARLHAVTAAADAAQEQQNASLANLEKSRLEEERVDAEREAAQQELEALVQRKETLVQQVQDEHQRVMKAKEEKRLATVEVEALNASLLSVRTAEQMTRALVDTLSSEKSRLQAEVETLISSVSDASQRLETSERQLEACAAEHDRLQQVRP